MASDRDEIYDEQGSIYGEPGSRCCILNGAAARTCQVGDEIIIAASSLVQLHDLYTLEPNATPAPHLTAVES